MNWFVSSIYKIGSGSASLQSPPQNLFALSERLCIVVFLFRMCAHLIFNPCGLSLPCSLLIQLLIQLVRSGSTGLSSLPCELSCFNFETPKQASALLLPSPLHSRNHPLQPIPFSCCASWVSPKFLFVLGAGYRSKPSCNACFNTYNITIIGIKRQQESEKSDEKSPNEYGALCGFRGYRHKKPLPKSVQGGAGGPCRPPLTSAAGRS